MPLYGTLDLATAAPRLPMMRDLDTEAWTLPKAEILQILIEVPRTTDSLLPRAMHPSVPSYVVFAVTHYPESPVGAFTFAALRLGSRAGAHPRGFLLGAYCSSEQAAGELRRRWALPVAQADVRLSRRHDRINGKVTLDGRTILDCALLDPEAISGGDVQYINWVTLGQGPLDGVTKPLLIQVDPHYTIHRAERGRPLVEMFDKDAWGAGPVRLADPVLATCCTVDTDLPRIRFVMDPEIPVFKGTRRIRDSREGV